MIEQLTAPGFLAGAIGSIPNGWPSSVPIVTSYKFFAPAQMQ